MDLKETKEWFKSVTDRWAENSFTIVDSQDVEFSRDLISEVERCHEAMKEFCERRDNGQVISHYTYMKFRKILDGVE